MENITQIAVGDQDGVLQVFAIKKEDMQVQFKTLPTDKITTIQLGGATGAGMLTPPIITKCNISF